MALKSNNRVMLFPRLNRVVIIVVVIASVVAGLRAYQLYRFIFDDNVKHATSVIIPKGAGFDQVLDTLKAHDILIKEKAFIWVSNKKEYPEHVKPGRYLFSPGMNSNQLINMLKAGNQEPVSVIFNNLRFMEELAGKISRYIEADSAAIIAYLRDTAVIAQMGFDGNTFPAMFIPNTYELYWTTTPAEFVGRMKREYNRFWNEQRRKKAEALGLTTIEVITIASIVQEETIKEDEKPVVAGLYLNRLRKGMPLQADPTIKYALGDFSIKRVLSKYLDIDSPYNTYKYAGLPPGPINFPEISSINAVLNPQSHDYLYMCAKEDFSGYHNFARTLAEHNRNARRYQQALNSQGIWQ